jgi:hypothetical protein
MLLTARLLPSQLPPLQKLSSKDSQGFHEELSRLRALLKRANDKGAVQFQIAKTYAAGGQYREAVEWLRKLVDVGLGFDPSRDPGFRSVLNTIEFQGLMKEVRRQTPPVSNSRFVAAMEEPDLFPENLAFDSATNTFFLGSTTKNEIMRCPLGSVCTPLVTSDRDGQGSVLGLKLDNRSATLWATSNAANGASLGQYDIQTGNLMRSARLEGNHVFNDLAVASTGTVYVTDTAQGAVYELDTQVDTLRKIIPNHTFTAANGIALSPDEETLYVSAWGDGVDVIDLKSGSATPMPHPGTVCLAYIDGLYATRGSLIAIQNGPMVPRIVQFRLNPDARGIIAMTTLERRNPLFDGITTGALVSDTLYYVANPQIGKRSSANGNKLQILALKVRH